MTEYKTYAVVSECWINGWVTTCDGEYIRTTDFESAKKVFDEVSLGQDGINYATALLGSDMIEDEDDPYMDFDWQIVQTNEKR